MDYFKILFYKSPLLIRLEVEVTVLYWCLNYFLKYLMQFLSPCPETRVSQHEPHKLPVLTSLPTVQSHMPNRNFVVATATQVNVTFCFYNSVLSWFLSEMRHWHASETRSSVFRMRKSWTGCAKVGPHVQI